MKRILFVDDDLSLLEGLRRLFHPLRDEWEMSFAASGFEALDLLSRQPFDVIITDIRMPLMDGVELLTRVQDKYPEMVRMVLSGQSERNLTLRSAATAHQYLSKPVNADTLRSTIARTTALKSSFEQPSLRGLVAGLRSLPSIPALYQELMARLEDPETSAGDVANIITRDTAMTVKVLQLANSAFFGVCRRITSARDAVAYLGMDTIKSLALCVNVFSQFRSSAKLFSIDELVRHSLVSGTLARRIATVGKASKPVVEDAFMAGLLHEVGVLILVDAFPDKYDLAVNCVRRTGMPIWAAEQEIFGANHADIGSYLLWLWGLPDTVVEAVAWHHAPSQCPVAVFGPLAAVHLADALMDDHDRNGGAIGDEVPQGLDVSYLDKLAMTREPAKWRALTREVLHSKEAA